MKFSSPFRKEEIKEPEEAENKKYISPWSKTEVNADGQIRPKSDTSNGSSKKSGVKKLVFGAGILIIILSSVAFWLFSRVGEPSVGLELRRPSEVAVGEIFEVEVNFSNYSDKVLKNVRLILSLPDGILFAGPNSENRVEEIQIGDMGPEGVRPPEKFKLIAVDGAQSIKKISAKLVYSVAPNEKLTFENEAEVDIRISQPAVGLEISLPESVFSGESFEIKVKYKNNTKENFENLSLELVYPKIFQFVSASIDPDEGDDYWKIGTLGPGEAGELLVNGILVGSSGLAANFEVNLVTGILSEKYVVNRKLASVDISSSPLSLDLSINGSKDYAAKLSDELNYLITYRNNSDFALQNVAVSVSLTGEMFDFSSVRSESSFNSLTNTFTWTAAENDKLAILSPGDQGTLSLRIKVKDNFNIRRLSDKDFVLKAKGRIESPTVPPGVNALKTVSVASLETKVGGKIEVDAQAFYRDAASGILNSGPFPPRANQPTEFTIHWKVKNYATDVSNVTVSAFLKSGARFTGKSKSTIGDEPVYDQASGKVVWTIPDLSATRGVVGSPVEAIFQISVTPNLNQIGKDIDILSETDIEATDKFTGKKLTNEDDELTTRLKDDPTISGRTAVEP